MTSKGNDMDMDVNVTGVSNIDNDMVEYESDNEDGPIGNDSEEETPISRLSRQMKSNLYRPLPYGQLLIEVGFIFDNVDHFRKVLYVYCIQKGST